MSRITNPIWTRPFIPGIDGAPEKFIVGFYAMTRLDDGWEIQQFGESVETAVANLLDYV